MAGKFLTLEEAARHLGVTVDEVQRFVDRKKLFPTRDGATIKFKVDDVERLVQELQDDVPQTEELSLDLEPVAPASALGDLSGLGDDAIEIGDAIDAGDSLFADAGDNAAAASNTLVRGGTQESAVIGDVSGLSLPAGSGASAAEIVFGDSATGTDDLDLESIVSASSIGTSSPSLAAAAKSSITGGPGQVDETLAIDLGDAMVSNASGSLAIGSDAGQAGSPEATGAGLALSGALDSGLSLEDGNIEMSGIDLGGDGAAAPDDGTVLGGDDFDLGGGGGDDESASVVIAESESGESSFFGQAMAGEGSAFGEESAALPSSIASEAMAMPGDLSPEMGFSGLQLAGLICCSLLLLFGGFIAYDLVRTIGSPESTTLANPLLDAMAGVFGWR
ncbi:MAG: helix-turn-helix domain-containing protein [Planctomycetia bacterium]